MPAASGMSAAGEAGQYGAGPALSTAAMVAAAATATATATATASVVAMQEAQPFNQVCTTKSIPISLLEV